MRTPPMFFACGDDSDVHLFNDDERDSERMIRYYDYRKPAIDRTKSIKPAMNAIISPLPKPKNKRDPKHRDVASAHALLQTPPHNFTALLSLPMRSILCLSCSALSFQNSRQH